MDRHDEIFLPGPWGELQRLLKYDQSSTDLNLVNARLQQQQRLSDQVQKSKSTSNLLDMKRSSSFSSRGRNDHNSIFNNTTCGAPVGTYNIRWDVVSDRTSVHVFPKALKSNFENVSNTSDSTMASSSSLKKSKSSKNLLGTSQNLTTIANNNKDTTNNIEDNKNLANPNDKNNKNAFNDLIVSDNDGFHSRPRRLSRSAQDTLANSVPSLISSFVTGIERVKSVPNFQKSPSSHSDALQYIPSYVAGTTTTLQATKNVNIEKMLNAKDSLSFNKPSFADFSSPLGRADDSAKKPICATTSYDPNWRAVRARSSIGATDMTLQQPRPDPAEWFVKNSAGCVAMEKLGVAGDYWEKEQLKKSISVPQFEKMAGRELNAMDRSGSYSNNRVESMDPETRRLFEERDKHINLSGLDRSSKSRKENYCLVDMKRQVDRSTVNRIYGGNPLEANPNTIMANLYHPNDATIVDLSWRCHAPNFSTMKSRSCAMETEAKLLEKCGGDWNKMPYENRTKTAAVKSSRQRTDAIQTFKREKKIGSSPAPVGRLDKSRARLMELRHGRDTAGSHESFMME